MTKDVYLYDIARSADARWLLALRSATGADDEFSQNDCDEILRAIDARIAQLNATAAGPQKARG